jgi:uncharacterized phiE125 gp8 family phage protein
MPVSLQHHYATLKTTVEPTVEPVTVEEALAFAEFEAEDATRAEIMRGLLVTARRKVERDAAVALITQTRVAKFDCFHGCEQEFHIVPIQSVAITYLDSAGDSQTWETSNFQVDTHNIPPRVAPVDGETWPTTATGSFNAATFTLVCGYGDSADSVPEEAKTAIKLLAKEWFWNRCPTGEVGHDVRFAYGALIDALSWRPML